MVLSRASVPEPNESCSMLRTAMFAIALLGISAMTSKVDASYCGVDVAGARARWAAARRSNLDSAHYEESCRTYYNQFFEAVKVRQAASICEDGIDRQRDLDMLDSEIDAFNNLIAAQCSGS
jgi:hypothetical protein